MANLNTQNGLLRIAGGDFRAQMLKNREIVDPQADREVVLGSQLPRQPPAHADVAEVVDDVAEDVPAKGGGGGGHG